jgi:NAD+ synthase
MMAMTINYSATAKRLSAKLAAYFEAAGMDNAVIGLSGGLDSSTTACLAADALGEQHVFGVMMPSHATNRDDMEHASLLARTLGIDTYKFDISDLAHSLSTRLHGHGLVPQTELTNGNISARLRSLILYNLASRKRALVLGTGDRSELLIGYFTKYGDGACDLLPIGSVYKTDLRAIARELGVPEKIIQKPPSPSLWDGHTAESELGASYEKIDTVLKLLFDRKMKPGAAAKQVKNPALVQKIIKMHEQSGHKRAMPPIL